MKEKVSAEIDLVREVLSGLARVRIDAGAWQDSESEELERETQVFKIGECLRPFYLAARDYRDQLDPLPLPSAVLLKDTETFLRLVEKYGFFPSPYSPIPGAKDQYTDFAAFVIDFCALAHDYWQADSKGGRRIVKTSKVVAEKALRFLLNPDNRLTDPHGTRWGGTSKYGRVKKAKEVYTDTFFTSVVILALQGTLEHPVLDLSTERRDDIRNVIRQAGKWICGRFDDRLITGDEARTNRRLVHTTWGLRALVETYPTQEQDVRKLLPSLTNAYLNAVQARLTREGFSIEQEYLTILSEEVDAPLYYEDRSSLGGILLTLSSFRSLADLEPLLEELDYTLVFERVFSSMMALRNQTTGLWYRQGLILSIHSYLVEALLMLSRRGKGFGRKIEVSGHMVRSAVQQAFEDEAVIAGLQQAVYERLLQLVEGLTQERTVQQEMSKLRSSSGEKTPRGGASRRARPGTRKK